MAASSVIVRNGLLYGPYNMGNIMRLMKKVEHITMTFPWSFKIQDLAKIDFRMIVINAHAERFWSGW